MADWKDTFSFGIWLHEFVPELCRAEILGPQLLAQLGRGQILSVEHLAVENSTVVVILEETANRRRDWLLRPRAEEATQRARRMIYQFLVACGIRLS